MAFLALHHKSSHALLKSTSSTLSFSIFFSSSSSSDNNNNGGDKPHPFSPYFSNVRSNLKNHGEQHHEQQHQSRSIFGKQNSATSFDDIRNNLSKFRRRSDAPASDIGRKQQEQPQPSLFQNLGGYNGNPNLERKNGKLSFDKIRESLSKLNAKGNAARSNDTSSGMSLNNYRKSSRFQPVMPGSGGGGVAKNREIGGSAENLPMSVFGKEIKEKKERMTMGEDEGGEDELSKFELLRPYSHEDLGKELKGLRPKVKGKEEGWFSIAELGERLKEFKRIEMEQATSTKYSQPLAELRDSIKSLKAETEKPQNAQGFIQNFGLSTLTNIMNQPPKEDLIEKYFHPDNMSAEEKLKLELKKVRDEFKMHESDCGSTRVQIAQLTTEILHLSSVLHKKDKHSRRGLQAKVQQRKKLLKYLRRTDWESYCYVLSKLGLRDNPDYKN